MDYSHPLIQEKVDELPFLNLIVQNQSPNQKIISTIEANTDALEMYIHHLPDVL